MSESSTREKRRRRPALSCEACRKRKIRCDRNVPCNHCTKSPGTVCTYVPQDATSRPSMGLRRLQPAVSLSPASGPLPENANSNASGSSTADVGTPRSTLSVAGSLVDKVQRLEVQLRQTKPQLGSKDTQSLPMLQASLTKSRFFGPSHWMNGATLFPLVIELLHRVEGDKASQLQREFARCKDLARVIKANRVPPFMSIRSEMPDRELADDLVDRYLRTFEAVFRIFHVPSFRADYEAYWADPAAARPSFVVAMQLCIAIGTTFREDVVKLRSLAVRLVCEAQIWLDSPREKSRVTMEGLQVMCLVLSARQIVGISGGDMSWVRAGGLLRQAMYCGLHRDPRHVGVVSRLGAEMRRRLWATVLELNLQSSIDAGGSPLLSLDDFDTEPPANLDDEDLVGDDKTLLAAGEERFTQTTTQIALLRSFPTRLAISRTVNNIRLRMPYDETVRLSGELTAACQALRPQLSRFPGTTDFQRRMVDMVTQRFFLALHTPRFRQSFEDPTYYFSRKACLDAALQLASLANLTTPNALETDFIRLVSSAGGPYGSIIYQATIIVGAELLTRKEERRRHGSAVALGEAELYAILEAALAWTERKLRNGETNIKGNTSHAAILAYANALDDRLDGAALEDSILEHAAARARVCYEILKEVSGEGSPAGPVDDVDWGMDADFDPFETTQMDFLHGWEYMPEFLGLGAKTDLFLEPA